MAGAIAPPPADNGVDAASGAVPAAETPAPSAGVFAKSTTAAKAATKSGDPASATTPDSLASDGAGATPNTVAGVASVLARQSALADGNGQGGKTEDAAIAALSPATANADGAAAVAVPVASASTAPVDAAATSPATGAGAAIVSQIADQIATKSAGKSTRFDVSLDPAGLGRVDVQVHIDSAGQVSASLSFTNAQSAADARSHAADLQQALEQAGFNVPQGGLSFDVGGHGAGFAQQQQQQNAQGQAAAGAAAAAFANTSPDSAVQAAIAARASSGAAGLDITI